MLLFRLLLLSYLSCIWMWESGLSCLSFLSSFVFAYFSFIYFW